MTDKPTGKIWWSPSTCGFYHEGINTSIPDDAMTITRARFDQLMVAQESGAMIAPDDGTGKPFARRLTTTAAQIRMALIRMVKREARRRIDAVAPAWRQLNDMREPSEDGGRRFAQVDAIRAASTLIEAQVADTLAASLDQFPITDNPLWPDC